MPYPLGMESKDWAMESRLSIADLSSGYSKPERLNVNIKASIQDCQSYFGANIQIFEFERANVARSDWPERAAGR